MKYIIPAFFIVLTLIFASGFGYIVYKENQYVPASNTDIENFTSNLRFSNAFVKEKGLLEAAVPNPQIKFHGWIPTWAMTPSLKTVEARKNQFASISPVFYHIQDDGSVSTDKKGLDELRTLLAGSSVKIIPTISSFNPDALSKNISTPSELANYNSLLMKEVDDNNYDGIDLNYESTYLKDKDAFLSHIQYLSQELHKRKKTFSVTVLSKWGDNINYGFAPETRKVQDYTEIGKVADQVRIMTYDFTSQGSANAGPIAPIKWMEEVLTYASNRINPSKIILGIHLYGYFWGASEGKARALDYRNIVEIKEANDSPDSFYSNENQEGALKYIGSNGKFYFGYYSSPEAIQARINLASKYGVSGVVFWRLGDDPL